jgi:fermentation-respiration switch protein FrsA (DUF1100 family)
LPAAPLRFKIKAPVLFIAASQDRLCPAAEVEKAAAKTPNAKLVAVDCGHFDVYSGEPLRHLMNEMVDFYLDATGGPKTNGVRAVDVVDQQAAAAADIYDVASPGTAASANDEL